jgi:hypothetical protein
MGFKTKFVKCHKRTESGNLPTTIVDSGYASHPSVGLVLSGGFDESFGPLYSVVQTQDGSRYVYCHLSLDINIV